MHFAYFNGVGYESTENEWGSWIGLSRRDEEALKRTVTVVRFFGAAGTKHLISPTWEPHVGGVANNGVFASIWPLNEAADQPTEAVWLFVNRANQNYTGSQFTLPAASSQKLKVSVIKWEKKKEKEVATTHINLPKHALYKLILCHLN